MHILLLFFALIVIILVVGVTLIKAVVRILFSIGLFFGFGKNRQQKTYKSRPFYSDTYRSDSSASSTNNSDHETKAHAESNPHKQKKIFTKDEGEYVDFEEIKDDSVK